MKNTKIIIPVLFCVLLWVSAAAVSAQSNLATGPACICLDENGILYTQKALETSVCYACTEETGCLPLDLTLMQCRTLNADALGVVSSPAEEPTAVPTQVPPTEIPTAVPTQAPPTEIPTAVPTQVPPTEIPTAVPTQVPPTEIPTAVPTQVPPTEIPTAVPTQVPPTEIPTAIPTEVPPTDIPISVPIEVPLPEELTEVPSSLPAEVPTDVLTEEPAGDPTEVPTEDPTEEYTAEPAETSTMEPAETSTTEPAETSTAEPAETSTAEPAETSTAEPAETSTAEPAETSTTEPTETSTNEPAETSTAEPGETSTTEPIETSTAEPGETSTAEPTETSTTEPAETSTAEPTETSTAEPTETSTAEPTETSTAVPTETSTTEPTETSTTEPTETSTAEPTETSTTEPTETSTAVPTETSTAEPTKTATAEPTKKPTAEPTPLPAPKAPVQECPVGTYRVRSLGFYWAPSKYAESYTVEWTNDRNQKGTIKLSNSDPTCKKGRCIAYTTLPGIGKYEWTVTAKNSSGSARSKSMKFEIRTNVTTPKPYSPNGKIYNRNYPAFQWEDVRDGVYEYRIQIVGKYDNRIRYDRVFDVNDIYIGNGVCYVQTNLFLPAGSYSWRVTGCNEDFCSNWSEWLDFYVECDYCNLNNGNYANTVPSTSYPTAVISTLTPEFQWRTLTGASYYIVRLSDSAGKQLFERQVSSTACTVEMCTWDPEYKLPGSGNYSWSVYGYGANGGFWGSSTGSFTVQARVEMKPMAFISPEQYGYLSQDAPMIIWSDPGEAIVLFNVEIFDGDNKSLLNATLDREQAWCDGTTCSIAFRTIPDGKNYRIAITPYSEYNMTGDKIELVFSKGGRPVTLKSPKEGSTVQARPLFRWALEGGEGEVYELTLKSAENMTIIWSDLSCGVNGVTCEDGEAFYSPSEALAPGSYTAVLDIPDTETVIAELKFTVE